MVVFTYDGVQDVKKSHHIIERVLCDLEDQGDKIDEEAGDVRFVLKGEQFIALFYPQENKMELYPTKVTNSVQYFEKRYPSFWYDGSYVVRTKRWA